MNTLYSHAGNPPPSINMPSSINATFNVTLKLPITVTGNNVTLTVQVPAGSNATANLPSITVQANVPYLIWTPILLTPNVFQVLATDALGQINTWTPYVYYCACLNMSTTPSTISHHSHPYTSTAMSTSRRARVCRHTQARIAT
jgi:hypothetical protein